MLIWFEVYFQYDVQFDKDNEPVQQVDEIAPRI